MYLGWKSRGENTICGSIWFPIFIPQAWADPLHPPSDQFQFNLCQNPLGLSWSGKSFTLPMSGATVCRQTREWENDDMWARGTGSRPTWSRQQRRPPPPITANPKREIFLLVSHFLYSWGAPEGQTPLFQTVGSFFWHRKSKKKHKKTTTFAYWADLTAQNCWQWSKCGPLRRWNNLQPLPSAVFKG